MNSKGFKVMEWLRKIRDEHSANIKDMTTKEILNETQERAKKLSNDIDELRKQKTSQNH